MFIYRRVAGINCQFGISISQLLKPQSYELFGTRYDVIGCINYNLEESGGGHYVTKLLPRPDDVWEIHEDSVKNVKRKPDFDSDAFIVCLKRFGEEDNLGNWDSIYLGCFLQLCNRITPFPFRNTTHCRFRKKRGRVSHYGVRGRRSRKECKSYCKHAG